MLGLTVKAKFADGIKDVAAHWELDAPTFDHRVPTDVVDFKTAQARRKLVPDEMPDTLFKRVIGAEGYEFVAVDTRKAKLEEATAKWEKARADHDFEGAFYWRDQMRRFEP